MHAVLVFGYRPLGAGAPGGGGWDWWAPVGAIVLFALLATARRRPPLALAIALSAVGGLILADATGAWGVVPVWGPLLIIVLARNLLRGGRRSQV
jgi:hypothetical protein